MSDAPNPTSTPRAWYKASIRDFLDSTSTTVLGRLAENCSFTILESQTDAWLKQIQTLQKQLPGIHGTVFFEFSIPRMGRRVDVILVIGPAVFVLEFKVGERVFKTADINQVWDYALDLKNFHEASHLVPICPILVATEATASQAPEISLADDKVLRPLRTNSAGLRSAIDATLRVVVGPPVDAEEWGQAAYKPTPTIIEAARALYAQHSVDAIARFDAGARNLHITSRRIEELVEEACSKRQKIICFITGVPGAGKTLVGLNIATRKREIEEETHAVFLSGNGPLVAVLREALTRDEFARRKAADQKIRKGVIAESVNAFIQNVHHFRDEGLQNSRPPVEHVVIFDEAQRAWNMKQTADFMLRRKKHADFAQSEPEFLISYMDRHADWAAIVCLVGGGQEINTGEAGIGAWLEAVQKRFNHWQMFISPRLSDSEYATASTIESLREGRTIQFDESLHLAVSMRSFRAENVSNFVKLLLDCDQPEAKRIFVSLLDRYPIVLTRNLDAAKRWIRDHARGSERYGLVASSKAVRLKPHAIDTRVEVNPVHYFLNESEDVRSSYYMEDAATEFQVQGLELDWVCVTWDADFRFQGSGWNYHDFRGNKWCNIGIPDRRTYLRNAYRVLLTRARQGMALFIPPGDPSDPTRLPDFYNSTFSYLKGLGIPEIP